ncbi:MAG: phosphate-starvation-inducible PsiE family protein [Methanomicrobiales archaeon]|jgi:uncharacterized membrane protein (DUF373 family)|nr:phosphate-starvation-inducible PsiE family protein [Methanomicrobiales archaeon]
MFEYLNRFEKGVYLILILVLAFVVGVSVVELVWMVIQGLINFTPLRLENYELLNLFGFFLLVLIGVELLDTIKMYIIKNEIHVEIVVLLAIIAIARKVILLEFSEQDYLMVISIGVLFISLSGGYYLVKRAGTKIE